MTRFLVITFDVYGTLSQWTETVQAVIHDLARTHRREELTESLVRAFEAESRRLQTVGPFRSYRAILADSLDLGFQLAGVGLSDEDRGTALERLSQVPPHTDASPVLAELARNHRLVPISNTDDALLAGTLALFGDVFDTTVTAEQARAYKPNPGLFRYASDKLKVPPSAQLHVAQGMFSDLAVCASLGIRTVWVNRQGTQIQEGLDPWAVIDDLSELPALVRSLD